MSQFDVLETEGDIENTDNNTQHFDVELVCLRKF
jgi:hypothetical protein